MKPEDMVRIQGLYQANTKKRRKGKIYTSGPYWWGWWMKDGKQTLRYIGKELPKELQYLLDGRVKLPGRKLSCWPAQKPVKDFDTKTPTP